MTRRQFLGTPAAIAAGAQSTPAARPSLCIFSKHLPGTSYEQLAAESQEIGFEGVDLTVRPQGHVLPENVAADLPRAVEALRRRNLQIPMITTGLISPQDPAAKPTFQTAAKLGIPYCKLGYWRYPKATGVEERLGAVRQDVAGLAALARDAGIQLGFHNHSGDYVGAAVWDAREIIGAMDPKVIGYYYDPGHATIEGGLAGWRLSLDLVLPRLLMVAVKDFVWVKGPKGWTVAWRPLGEGMVDWKTVFAAFARSRFHGPLSLHVEYHAADEKQAIRRDLDFMRAARNEAYG